MMNERQLAELLYETSRKIVEGLGATGDLTKATVQLAARLSEAVDEFVTAHIGTGL